MPTRAIKIEPASTTGRLTVAEFLDWIEGGQSQGQSEPLWIRPGKQRRDQPSVAEIAVAKPAKKKQQP